MLALSMRVEYHTRYSLSDVDQAHDVEPKPRWYWPLLREAFGLYCSMRRRAVPRGRQAAFLPRGGHVPQIVQNALKARGVHDVRNLSGQEIQRQAAKAVAARVRSIRGKPIMVWMDNLFRMDASYNP